MIDKPQYFSQLWNKSAVIIAIRAASIIASFIVIVYYSRTLEKDDYGHYLSFLVHTSIITSIGAIGLQSLVFNFNRNSLLSYLRNMSIAKWSIYLVFISLTSILSYLILSMDKSLEWVVILFFLFTIMSFVLDSALIVIARHIFLLLLNVVFALGFIYIHLYLAISGTGTFHLNGLIDYWTILLGIKVTFQLILLFKNISTYDLATVGEEEIRYPKAKTWWLLGFYETFQLIARQADKAIFFILFPKELGAIYYNGRIDIPLLPAFLSSIRTAALMKLSDRPDTTHSISIVRDALRILSIIALGVFSFGFVYSTELFTVVFTQRYEESVPFFLISLLLIPIQFCISTVFVLQYKERIHIINYGAFIDLITSIILSIILFPYLGAYSIITAIVISTLVQSLYYLWHSGVSLGVKPTILLPLLHYGIIGCGYLLMAWTSHFLARNVLDLNSIQILISGIIIGVCTMLIIFVLTKKNNKTA